nr:MAG TPA: hypothetical protein [Caudoviricetes sp.]
MLSNDSERTSWRGDKERISPRIKTDRKFVLIIAARRERFFISSAVLLFARHLYIKQPIKRNVYE